MAYTKKKKRVKTSAYNKKEKYVKPSKSDTKKVVSKHKPQKSKPRPKLKSLYGKWKNITSSKYLRKKRKPITYGYDYRMRY